MSTQKNIQQLTRTDRKELAKIETKYDFSVETLFEELVTEGDVKTQAQSPLTDEEYDIVKEQIITQVEFNVLDNITEWEQEFNAFPGSQDESARAWIVSKVEAELRGEAESDNLLN